MPVYSYTAITINGSLKESTVEAPSEVQAKSKLRGKGERVIRINVLSEEQTAQPKQRAGKKPSSDDVSTTIRQLSILIKSGVPLVEALQGLTEQTRNPVFAACLEDITRNVSHGTALSEAFAKHPNIFPTLAIEMSRVAEAGGDLAGAMGKLADHLEVGAEIGRKVKSALAYPIVVVVISLITVIVMVTFILPQFMKMFSQMGAKLPWTTQMLMSFSKSITGHWYVYLGGIGLGYYLFRRFEKTPVGRRKLDGLILKLPLVGDIVTKVVLSRVISTMATLLSSGVPMIKTLETSAAAANNEIVKDALLKARTDIAEGTATSQSLKACGMFPPLVLQMVASGEKTGELPAMLEYVCNFYNRETDAKVKSLTSIIEPVMITVLGVIVGFIAISVIVPIYSLVGGVK